MESTNFVEIGGSVTVYLLGFRSQRHLFVDWILQDIPARTSQARDHDMALIATFRRLLFDDDDDVVVVALTVVTNNVGEKIHLSQRRLAS